MANMKSRILTVAVALLLLLVLVSAFPTRSGAIDFSLLGESGEWSTYLLHFKLSRAPGDNSLLLFEYKDTGNFRAFRFLKGKVVFEEYIDGEQKVIATAELPPSTAGELMIKRAKSYAALIFNGKTILLGSIGNAVGKSFGTGCENGGSVPAFQKMQPIEEVYFTDSFMRTEDAGEWDVVSGFWENCGLSFAERSTNPFSIFSRFPDSEQIEMLENGRLLEEKTGIGVNISPYGHVSRIAGQAPAAEAGIQQDDVIIEVNKVSITQMWYRLENAQDGEKFDLKVMRGNKVLYFTVIARRYRWGEVEKRYPIQPAKMDKQSLLLTGYPFWFDYSFRASVKPLGEGYIGLVFYYRDAKNYFAFRWYGDNSHRKGKINTLELVSVEKGIETVLASKPGGFFSDQYSEMRVSVIGDEATAYIDKVAVLSFKSNSLTFGKAGLEVGEGYGVYFDDVRIVNSHNYIDEPRRRAVNDIHKQQSDMRDWSDPSRDFSVRFSSGSYVFSYKYDCFNTTSVILYPSARYKFFCIDAFADDKGQNGIKLLFTPSTNEFEISCGDYKKNEIVKEFNTPQANMEFVFERNSVAIYKSGKHYLTHNLPVSASGTRFSITGLNEVYRGRTACVEIRESDDVKDYTFDESPTDWFVLDGKWGVMNKWICDPRWSWFGGVNLNGPAAIASKYDLEGDFSVDAYFASMMMVNDPPYEMLGNYCMSVCTNGRDISSGYSYFIGGSMNYWIGVMRGEDVMRRENRRSRNFRMLPHDNRLQYLQNEVVHQRWFHGRITRIGKTLSFYFDGNLFHSFDDPQMLAGKRVMLWTYHNGWLLSRVRVAAQKLVPVQPEFSTEQHFDTKWWNDAGARRSRLSAAIDKPDKDLITVTLVENGNFAVHAKNSIIELSEFPSLSFSAALPPGFVGDLYFDHNGITHRVRISGPAQDEPLMPSIGEVPFECDGRLHTVVIPIARMLAEYIGESAGKLTISNVRFGQLYTHDYIAAGFKGNRAGAKFVLGAIEPLASTSKYFDSLVILPNGAPEVRLMLNNDCGRINYSRAVLSINGKQTTKIGATYISSDGSCLIFSIADVLSFTEGQNIEATVSGLRTVNGSPIAPVRASSKYNSSDDKTPPVLLTQYIGDKPAVFQDYELPDKGQRTYSSRATGTLFAFTQWDRTTASSGRASLKVSSDSIGGIMRANLFSGSFNVTENPLISFDYKTNHDVPLSVLISASSRTFYMLGFNDESGMSGNWFGSGKESIMPSAKIGDFVKPIVDGQWHNTYAKVDTRLLRATNFDTIFVADTGFRGGYVNDTINIDNLMVSRFIPAPKELPKLEFAESGKVSKVLTSITTWPDEPEGVWTPDTPFPFGSRFYLNVKACDQAGNWSETKHMQFFCDFEPPQLTRIFWRNKALFLYWKDDNLIDRDSLQIEVEGKPVSVNKIAKWATPNEVSLALSEAANKPIRVRISDSLGNTCIYQILGNRFSRIDTVEDL